MKNKKTLHYIKVEIPILMIFVGFLSQSVMGISVGGHKNNEAVVENNITALNNELADNSSDKDVSAENVVRSTGKADMFQDETIANKIVTLKENSKILAQNTEEMQKEETKKEIETEISIEINKKQDTILETEAVLSYTEYGTPANNSFKSYMDYKYITDKRSRQYQLQKNSYTDESGIRIAEGRYCVALGSYYTNRIGTYVDIVMENGSVIEAILSDCKSDRDTEATRRQNANGSIVEFIVETDKLPETVKRLGDLSNIDERFRGEVKSIRVYH